MVTDRVVYLNIGIFEHNTIDYAICSDLILCFDAGVGTRRAKDNESPALDVDGIPPIIPPNRSQAIVCAILSHTPPLVLKRC